MAQFNPDQRIKLEPHVYKAIQNKFQPSTQQKIDKKIPKIELMTMKENYSVK